MRKSLVDDLKYTLSPALWLESLGMELYQWQRDVLDLEVRRGLINGARQAGKSTLVSGIPTHAAKYHPGSLSVILGATEKQAVEDMEKIKALAAMDPDYPAIKRDSDSIFELDNHSRILVIPATEKGARGFSQPLRIILDEASRIEDPVYQSGVRAMLTANKRAQLVMISTPNGRRGFFPRAYNSDNWTRFEVYAPWEVRNGALIRAKKLRSKVPGVRYYESPRHMDQGEMEEHLHEMGELMFKQEYLVEFVEPEDQAFGYDEIAAAFGHNIMPLVGGNVLESVDVQPLMGV